MLCEFLFSYFILKFRTVYRLMMSFESYHRNLLSCNLKASMFFFFCMVPVFLVASLKNENLLGEQLNGERVKDGMKFNGVEE